MNPSQEGQSGVPRVPSGPAAPAAPLRAWPASKVRLWPLDRITEYARNTRLHTDDQVRQIADSMTRFGVTTPLLVDEAGVLIYGHGRKRAAELLGYEKLPVAVAEGWTEDEKSAYRIADNQLTLLGEWDMPALQAEIGALKLTGFDLPLLGFPQLQLVEFLSGMPGAGTPPASQEEARRTLAQQFGVPPFSVLNAREGWWQDRKRAWIALGIQSELGRGENLLGRSPQEMFCHLTGIHYDKASKIVAEAMAAQGPAFDLGALVELHGGTRRFNAVPGGGANATESAKLPLDRRRKS